MPIIATPPAPPAITYMIPTAATESQRVTPVAPVAIPMYVPAYRRAAQRRGWPFATTTADANAVARAVLATIRRDGGRVSRVRVRQDVARSDVAWWVTTNGARRYRRMTVVLGRGGRGMLATVTVVPVACCVADPTR